MSAPLRIIGNRDNEWTKEAATAHTIAHRCRYEIEREADGQISVIWFHLFPCPIDQW